MLLPTESRRDNTKSKRHNSPHRPTLCALHCPRHRRGRPTELAPADHLLSRRSRRRDNLIGAKEQMMEPDAHERIDTLVSKGTAYQDCYEFIDGLTRPDGARIAVNFGRF